MENNTKNRKKYADMHMHTIYSDATNYPEGLVRDSALLGLEVISITDHDITEGYGRAKKEAKKWNIEVLTGVEISTEIYHILGLNFDINDTNLQQFLYQSRKYQDEIVKERIRRLSSVGVPIDFEKVRAYFPESRLGKYNIFMTLLMDPDCRRYHTDKYLSEIYAYFRKGGIASNLKGMQYVDLKESIDAIHSAGGIAILAHPFKEISEDDYAFTLDYLVKKGIDGIEIQPGYNGRNDKFRHYAEKKGLIISYGSDYHGACMPERKLIGRNGNLMDFSWIK